jgi:hypothetical protein
MKGEGIKAGPGSAPKSDHFFFFVGFGLKTAFMCVANEGCLPNPDVTGAPKLPLGNVCGPRMMYATLLIAEPARKNVIQGCFSAQLPNPIRGS